MSQLDGRVAVVMGASRGIGKGIAVELALAGATVYVTGRTLETSSGRPGSITSTVSDIESLGGRAIAVQCDATDDAEVEAVVRRIEAEQGILHVLVNSVFDSASFGPTIGKRFWELPLTAWSEIVDRSTRSAYVACVLFAPLLMRAGEDQGGLVVNVSALGARKYFYNVPYGVGKAALDKMTADMAIDCADSGVAVVSIWPNVTRTEGVEASIRAGEGHRFDRFGGPEGLETPRYSGRAVVALAGDPDRLARSGQYFWSAELGELYGFLDENGRDHAYPRRR